MSECRETEIREMLPDLLHGALASREQARIEAHLSRCEACREELDVLRVVRGAAVFTPPIDAERILRQIPPYRIIELPPERRAPSRPLKWLVAAGVAVVFAGAGSLLVLSGRDADAPRMAVESAPVNSAAGGLALASGVEDLSDGGLVQLMNEMGTFDALPVAEPEPVFSMDDTSVAGEDSL